MFNFLRFLIVALFFFCDTGNFFLPHSILFFGLIHLLYPKYSLGFFKSLFSKRRIRNNYTQSVISFFQLLTILIVVTWPFYLLKMALLDIDPITSYMSSFNNMLVYAVGIWSSGIFIYILIKKNLFLITRHIFWVLQAFIFFIQNYLPNIYRNLFVEIGFTDLYLNSDRLPLTFEEPSSASVYIFVFTIVSVFLFLNKKTKIDLVYILFGLFLSIVIIQSKAFFFYFAVFALVYLMLSIKQLNLKKILITVPLFATGIYILISSEFMSQVFNIFNNITNINDLVYSHNLSFSTRSYFAYEGIKTFIANPLGVGRGFVNDYLSIGFANSSFSHNWELRSYAITNQKISTKTYLLDFLVSYGIVGILFLWYFLKKVYKQIKNSNQGLFFKSLIPLSVAAIIVEGFYFFFLLFYLFTISNCIEHPSYNK